MPCTKTCGEIIPSCQHQCKKACHYKKPNEHGLCSELVEKEVYPCRHRVRLPCHREPTSDQCTELVQVRLPCNHFAQVTCAMRNSHNLNRTICREPCRTILSCGHPCRGTCSDCRVGRLHLPCQETCVRKMLCSHVSEMDSLNASKKNGRCSRFKRPVPRFMQHVGQNVKHVVLIPCVSSNVVNRVQDVER